jgi:hypothetical protein
MTIWFTARAAGLAALVLLSLTTAIGALVSGTGVRSVGDRVVVQYLHRVTAALGLGALALHIGAILADSLAGVGVTGAVVPFTSGYRATWVGLGTIAGYCLVLTAALGFARGRLAAQPRAAATWRALHCVSYAAWLLAVVHGFASGTDSGIAWVRIIYLGCVTTVVGAATARCSTFALGGRHAEAPPATRRAVVFDAGVSR